MDKEIAYKYKSQGPDILSDSELLSLYLGTKVNVKPKELLKMSKGHYKELGIPSRCYFKADILKDLFIRINQSTMTEKVKISCSMDVFTHFKWMGYLDVEHTILVILNAANFMVHYSIISIGGQQSTIIDTKVVLRKTIEIGGTAFILIHNHPSGSITPSEADISIAKKISVSATAVDLKMLDFIIIAEDDYYCFADEEIL